MKQTKQIDGYKVFMNELLGRGSYGDVYAGVNDKTKQKVAIKMLRKANIDADEYLKAALFSEIKILQSVKSTNVVGFEQVMESNQYYYVIQQLCDGDLSHYMKKNKNLSEEKAIQILTQISNGFLALVKQGIIHRDLKPANIMLKNGQIKIGDFGFAKKTGNLNAQNNSIVGTPLYMSIQILKNEHYTSKSDIWAIGLIFYELIHGDIPWPSKTETQLAKNIQTKQIKIKQDLKQTTKNFIRRCLQVYEKDRISWDQYFTHPIFKGYFNSYGDQKKEFENKLKMIMRQLRFKINSQNLDLCRILMDMGYNNPQNQLNFKQFYSFLKAINTQLLQQQAVYIFKETDTDNSGSISIKQIEQKLTENSIDLRSKYTKIPLNKKQSLNQHFNISNDETQQKTRKCFIKLDKIIRIKGVSLYQVFRSFDKNKSGSMDFVQFKHMMNKLSNQFVQEQLKGVFELIDTDNSNSIQFKELNSYFSKVNGIPEFLNSNIVDLEASSQKNKKIKPNQNISQGQSNYQTNTTNQSYPPPFMYGNYPPPSPYFYNNPYMNPQQQMYPMQQQQPPMMQQSNNGGIFGNFIFNQLSMGLNKQGMNNSK